MVWTPPQNGRQMLAEEDLPMNCQHPSHFFEDRGKILSRQFRDDMQSAHRILQLFFLSAPVLLLQISSYPNSSISYVGIGTLLARRWLCLWATAANKKKIYLMIKYNHPALFCNKTRDNFIWFSFLYKNLICTIDQLKIKSLVYSSQESRTGQPSLVTEYRTADYDQHYPQASPLYRISLPDLILIKQLSNCLPRSRTNGATENVQGGSAENHSRDVMTSNRTGWPFDQ